MAITGNPFRASTGSPYYSYSQGQSAATQGGAATQQAQDTAAQVEAQRAQAKQNVAGSGYNLGALANDHMYTAPSAVRADQTQAERVAERGRNFFYGGSETGRQDAIGSLRGNMAPYVGQLGAYGDRFMGASNQGSRMFAPGVTGTYGAAGQLANLAQQGPGPSLAQAQLDASTANAMRQQLALAGSGRGQGGGAAAFQAAAQNQAQIQGAANAQSAMLRAQEQDAWRRTQAGMLAQSGQLYGQGGELASRHAAAMGGLGLGAQQAAAGTQMGVEQGVHGINMGGLQGSTGYEQLLAQVYGIDKGVAIQNAQLAAQQEAATWGAIGSGVTTAAMTGAMLAASDISAKTNIVPAGPQLSQGPMAPAQGAPLPAASIPLPAAAEGEEDDPSGFNQKKEKPGAPATPEEKARKEEQQRALYTALAGSAGQFTTNLGLAMSDERTKSGAKVTPSAALSAVSRTNPWQYQYKNPGAHGQGTHYGPMAQELAQTPVGRSTLVRMPDGKLGVDTGRLALVNTAAMTAKAKEDRVQSRALTQRLDALEKELAGLRRAG